MEMRNNMWQKKIIICLLFIILLFFCSKPTKAIGFAPEDLYQSIVVIVSGNSLGSGFFLENNLIITNAHVIDNKNRVYVSLYKGDTYIAELVDISRQLDIAVLRIDNLNIPFLSIAKEEDISIGEDVYAIGAPNNMAYTLTKGVLSAKDRQVGNIGYIQTDASINSGNSGGPLVNDSGKVIGMNALKVFDTEGIGLAIPINVIIEYLKQNEIGLSSQVDSTIESQDSQINSSDIEEVKSMEDLLVENSQLKSTNYSLKIYLFLLIISNLITGILLILLLINKKRNKTKNDDVEFDIDILD
ncbi:trypsin-like serine protease [Tissierella creatinini]|nr:trypsin-like serine protease [Tissierella creatinini]TJX61015.1 trypsin-like serine protease [Soehngenia saccharolytica]